MKDEGTFTKFAFPKISFVGIADENLERRIQQIDHRLPNSKYSETDGRIGRKDLWKRIVMVRNLSIPLPPRPIRRDDARTDL